MIELINKLGGFNMFYSTREQNELIVLSTIIHQPKISRAEISQKTNLNKATISEIVKKLIAEKLINEIGIGTGAITGGRKPIQLQLNKLAGITLNIDLGYDYVSSMLTYLNGEIVETQKEQNILVTRKNVIPLLKELILSYQHSLATSQSPIIGIAIAIHGVVYENKILFTPYYDLDHFDLQKELMEEIKLPVYLENEANLTALAEKTFSTTKKTIVSISIHSGIGAGIILDGDLYTGKDGRSGEIGHSILYPDGLPCPCGNHGCLEQYCSEKAILSQLAVIKGMPNFSLIDLLQLLEQEDKETMQLIHNFVKYLSIGINNIIASYGPEIVYLNSPLLRKIPNLLPMIRENMTSSFNKLTPILESDLGSQAVLLGASSLNIQNFLSLPSLNFYF